MYHDLCHSHEDNFTAHTQATILHNELLPHLPGVNELTHWGWMMHICISKLTIIGSDNGLLPGWCQTIIGTNAGILLIRPMGTNFNEILIKIYTFSFEKMNFKISSGKWQPSCLGLDILFIFYLPQAVTQKYYELYHSHNEEHTLHFWISRANDEVTKSH